MCHGHKFALSMEVFTMAAGIALVVLNTADVAVTMQQRKMIVSQGFQ